MPNVPTTRMIEYAKWFFNEEGYDSIEGDVRQIISDDVGAYDEGANMLLDLYDFISSFVDWRLVEDELEKYLAQKKVTT